MDDILQQRTRYILRSRIRRAQTCPVEHFELACKHLMDWVDGHPILGPVCCTLSNRYPELRKAFEDAFSLGNQCSFEYDATSLDEHAAYCLFAVKSVAEASAADGQKQNDILHGLCNLLLKGRNVFKVDEWVEHIRNIALDGLFEYLDEALDQRNAIIGLLVKYKQSSEWFRRHRLRNFADNGLECKRGERGLQVDLFEYILNQGVEFSVEPASASGEADIILRLPAGGHVVIDAKYIPEDADNSKIRAQLSEGIHQVLRYCQDFNEANGFLVTFFRSNIRVSLELEDSDGFPYINIAGKTIYYIPVLIADEVSASKSGKAKELSISRTELLAKSTEPSVAPVS